MTAQVSHVGIDTATIERGLLLLRAFATVCREPATQEDFTAALALAGFVTEAAELDGAALFDAVLTKGIAHGVVSMLPDGRWRASA